MADEIQAAVPRIWDQQPGETEKAFLAFRTYREMPLYGPEGEKRNYDNLAAKLGLNSIGSIQFWAGKYKWRERIRAYDEYSGLKMEEYRAEGRAVAQQAYYMRTSGLIIGMSKAIEEAINRELNSKEPNVTNLSKLAVSIEKLDQVARRMLNLPTTFTQKPADEAVTEEEKVFIVGPEADA